MIIIKYKTAQLFLWAATADILIVSIFQVQKYVSKLKLSSIFLEVYEKWLSKLMSVLAILFLTSTFVS
jgi:hypothetical protein